MSSTISGTGEQGLQVVLARVCAIGGVALIAFPVAAAVLAALNTMWRRDGDILGQVIISVPYLVVGIGLLVWPVQRHRTGRRDFLPRRPGHVLRALALVAGVLLLGYALFIVAQVLWFELTYYETGNVGASFSILGIWMAYFIATPVAAVLAAVGVDALPRPRA